MECECCSGRIRGEEFFDLRIGYDQFTILCPDCHLRVRSKLTEVDRKSESWRLNMKGQIVDKLFACKDLDVVEVPKVNRFNMVKGFFCKWFKVEV